MNPNEPVAKSGTSRYRWLWLFLVALLATGPVMLVYYIVRFSQNELRTAQARIQALAPTDRQPPEPQSRPSDPVRIAPVTPPAAPAAPVLSKVLPHIVRIRVRFNDFDTIREAYALVVEYGDSTAHLIAPAETFAPVTGKVNGRLVIRGASENVEAEFWQPGNAGGFGPPAMGGMGGMGPGGFGMGSSVPSAGSMAGSPMGMPGGSYGPAGGIGSGGFGAGSFTFSSLKELPETGLAVVLVKGIVCNPIRILGDSPKASVGDKLKVVSLGPSPGTDIELPGLGSEQSSELTVLGVDESVQNESGNRLDHLIKLTAWTGEPGVVVCNEKGDPIGQIALTTSGTAGTRLSYAVPMDRIFQAFYSQHAPSDSNVGGPIFPSEPERTLPFVAAEETSPLPGDKVSAPDVSGAGAAGIRPADAINPDQSMSSEIRAYRVRGNVSDTAETIRTLFGDVAKVAVDRVSQSLIVMASADVHQKVEAIIRQAEESGAELLPGATDKGRSEREEAETIQSQLAAAFDEAAKKEAADWEAHRKEPRRTRFVKVPGRPPRDVAKLLTDLFGEKASIGVDEPTGTVLITINRAETWSEVQFLLAEIEATVSRLVAVETAGEMPSDKRPAARGVTSSNPSDFGAGLAAGQPLPDDSEGALDQEAKELAIRLRTAAPADAPALRGELERLTQRHFERRQALRKQEIDELSNRVDKLRMTHQRRQQNKQEVIQRRIRELLDPNNDLNWKESQTGLEGAATSLAAGFGPIVLDGVSLETIADVLPGAAGTATAVGVEKTFDGVPYSQWLKMLKTEQKRAKLTMAVEACSRLAKPEDVREIIRGIFVAAAVIELEAIEQEDVNLLNSALNRLPAADVVDELLAALNAPETSKSDHAFLGYYLAVECSESIIEVLKSRDQEVVQALIKPALQTEQNQDRDWLLAAACRIWRLSDRPASDFEGLLQLVIQCFDSGPTVEGQSLRPEWRYVVESLIVKIPETPELAMKLMKHAAQNSHVLELVGQLGRNAESVVPLIVDDFVREWNILESWSTTPTGRLLHLRGHYPNHPPRIMQLITALGEIGSGEKGAALLRDLSLIAHEYNGREAVFQTTITAAMTAKEKFSPLRESYKVPLLLSDSTMLIGRWNWTKLSPGTTSPNYAIQFNHDRTIHRHASTVDQVGTFDHVQLPEAFVLPIWDFTTPQRFQIDPTKSPKRISLIYPGLGGAKSEIRREGLYELTATTLRIQLSANDSPPTAFAADNTMIPEGQVLLELTRVTPLTANDQARPQ